MKIAFAAALALTAASPAFAQATTIQDLSYVAPAGGNWVYSPGAAGSEATFFDSASRPQVTLRCTRTTRRVAIVKPASAASSTLSVWTSSQKKAIAATFDATASRVTAELAAFDPLLDAIVLSRGRIGFSAAGAPALVVPPWSEVGRVVEDCRV
jgi:hypothetical protein